MSVTIPIFPMAYHHFSSFSHIFWQFSAQETTPLPFGHVTLWAQEDGPLQSQGLGESFVHRDGLWWPCAHNGCAKVWEGRLTAAGVLQTLMGKTTHLYVRLFLNFYGVMMVMVMMMMMMRRNFFKHLMVNGVANFQINPLEVNIEQREGEVIGAEMMGLEVQPNQS